MSNNYEPKSEAGRRVLNSMDADLKGLDNVHELPKPEPPKKSYVDQAQEIADSIDAN